MDCAIYIVDIEPHCIDAVPRTPTGFNLSLIELAEDDIIATFDWDMFQGVADSYIFVVSSEGRDIVNHSSTNFDTSLTAHLDYNTVYNATLTLMNCAGKGGTATLYNLLAGKDISINPTHIPCDLIHSEHVVVA